MTFAPQEPDDESDIERRQQYIVAARRRLVDALQHVSIKGGSADRQFVVDLRTRDLATLSDSDVERLGRIIWTYRRDLPRDLAPKLPPHDPVVRAMELVNV